MRKFIAVCMSFMICGACLYEPLLWGRHAPVKHKRNTVYYIGNRKYWNGYDVSGWGAPFNAETKMAIPGVYTGRKERE